MARVREEEDGITWHRPATPQMEKVNGQWVSKGWNELEHAGFAFKAMQRPPAADEDRARLAQELGVGSLPAHVYVGSSLSVRMLDTGLSLDFSAEGALSLWAEEGRKNGLSGWIFPAPYIGTVSTDKAKLREMLRLAKRIEAPEFARSVQTRMQIPTDALMGRDAILFYDSLPLLQEEGAGGSIDVSLKIRVMRDFFLILVRSYVVTDAAVCMRDVRYFHHFGHKHMLQDAEVREASMGQLEAAVARMRPVSASVSEKVTHDRRYFSNPEQVYEALEPHAAGTNLISLTVL